MIEFEEDLDKVLESTRFNTENEQIFFRNKKEEFIKKYQPKPLPAIPQFVADVVEKHKRNGVNFLFVLNQRYWESKDFQEWLNEETEEILMRAWIDGYTIEKEKKFCLKHIDMSKRDEKYDVFLFRTIDDDLGHVERKKEKNDIDLSDLLLLFTQQEIDKMNVGSYEKIEVKE